MRPQAQERGRQLRLREAALAVQQARAFAADVGRPQTRCRPAVRAARSGSIAGCRGWPNRGSRLRRCPRPMLVAAPSDVPVGRLKPFGNGLSRKAIGVRPSRLTTIELDDAEANHARRASVPGGLQSRRRVIYAIGRRAPRSCPQRCMQSRCAAPSCSCRSAPDGGCRRNITNRASQRRCVKNWIGRHAAGNRRRRIEIEDAVAVETLRTRHVQIVTQPQGHRQFR